MALLAAAACSRANPLYDRAGGEGGAVVKDSSVEHDAARDVADGSDGALDKMPAVDASDGALACGTPAGTTCPLPGAQWSFESGIEEWHFDAETFSRGNGELGVSCEQSYCGARSARLQAKLQRTSVPSPGMAAIDPGSFIRLQHALMTSVCLCGTLQAQIYIEDTLNQPLQAWFIAGLPIPNSDAGGETMTYKQAGPISLQAGWTAVRLPSPANATQGATDLRLVIELGGPGQWEGPIWIDDVGSL